MNEEFFQHGPTRGRPNQRRFQPSLDRNDDRPDERRRIRPREDESDTRGDNRRRRCDGVQVGTLDLSSTSSSIVNIADLPRFRESGQQKHCVICLEAIAPGDKVLRLPCMHQFHADCMLPALRTGLVKKCPIDRVGVLTEVVEELPIWSVPLPAPPPSPSDQPVSQDTRHLK